MALKVESSQLLKGFVGTVIVYSLMNFNTPLLEWLMSSDMSVTWISFFIGLFNVAAGALAYVIMQTFGTLDKEMYAKVREEREKINDIAADIPLDNKITEKVEILDEEYDKTGKVLSETEVEKRIDAKNTPPPVETAYNHDIEEPIIEEPQPTPTIEAEKARIEAELAELESEPNPVVEQE